MLPAHIAENIRKQILYYLQSTFAFRDRRAEKQFERFLIDPEKGIFKGPWVTLRRPYRPAPEGVLDNGELFDFSIPFHPYRHQYLAWKRLSSKNKTPECTIVTTGTGSGKTECFLYPILDHCLRAKKQGQKGIKAIILYPMNALASDQEKRFASVIWKEAALKNAGIRVGNYTGRYDPSSPGASAESGTKVMGEDHGITHHGVQQENPPDILLTNYKMLDFLLMRPQDQNLWRFNEKGILTYLVLDELHTYDGAQGADVACLIRRLKERLEIDKRTLCVVGTSATLDKRETLKDSSSQAVPIDAMELAVDRLARFAATLFEEEISPDGIIVEDRLDVEEIVSPDDLELSLPDPQTCDPLDIEDTLQYAMRQAVLWQGPAYTGTDSATEEQQEQAMEQWTLDLGTWLKKTRLFRYLLEIFHMAERKGEDPYTWKQVVEGLSHRDLGFSAVEDPEDRQRLVMSFFALVAHAKEQRSGRAVPLVPTQVQLWVRELRRVGRIVSDTPAYAWLDEPPGSLHCLPVFHCSECGESGWIALHDPKEDAFIGAKGVQGIMLEDDPSKIYRAWFGARGRKGRYIVVISPWDEDEGEAGTQQTLDFANMYLCPASLVIRQGDGPCPITDDTRRFRVRVNRDTDQDQSTGEVYGVQGCPRCGSIPGLFFIGSQASTLASVAIDEMFGTPLNDDPKLLAFTDSVQDASHRAGFFSARTYHFTFRTALQHIIDAASPEGLRLQEVGRRLLDYWSQPDHGRPGSVKEAMGALMPPDLQEYEPWVKYRDNDAMIDPPPSLREEIETRLTWEACSEFGLMQTHGRTMEPAGSACMGWDEELVSTTVADLKERLPGIDPHLEKVDEERLRLWVYGMLHRYRERGAVGHDYLIPLARQNFWGKYPFGRAVPGRETYPSAIRYRPRFMVTQPTSYHENVLAPTRGNMPPWHIKWARRALVLPVASEATILDLIRCMLDVGAQAGLLNRIHQDGSREYYWISPAAAILFSEGAHYCCSYSGKSLVRPSEGSEQWGKAPSMEYHADRGVYTPCEYSPRQKYYQDRYRKGALRRVVAHEHTALLATEERELLERSFAEAKHADDPNILTCTSTLEMGIDIGDLSSTMLCSIPPSTANYIQRIGRAGRATGTALIISIVNQRPHDLFFYARPDEILKGRIDPPGCWLDASAVLVRQYLAFCFDCASKSGTLHTLPSTAGQLVEDLNATRGSLPVMFEWVTMNEDALRDALLGRVTLDIQPDTRERFIRETATELLVQRIHLAANEFDRMRKDLVNARKRLQDQLKTLEEGEVEAKLETDREIKIINGRLASLNRTSALEILTDHGLLPNYAFPERGVRFHGALYNKHRGGQEHRPIEVTRPAGSAIRELAPGNVFYTQRRQFDIQQIAIGNPQLPLIEKWAICGLCGHMRRVEDLGKPEASPYCPQCGHGEDHQSQLDMGQHKQFIQYSRSQALSYMEHYDSLSGDRDEERQREYYQVVTSFDQTIEAPVGAVADEGLPFGIEYRSAMILRNINVGYHYQVGVVPFGNGVDVPEEGFRVCRHCGVVAGPGDTLADVKHRRSCQARRRYEKMKQEGRQGDPFEWEQIYLYRELRSEAIRLLLPVIDDEDVATLTASIYLGLRLRFEGNPAYLLVIPQVLPDAATGIRRYYLVIMDAVPGGTGYLKTLYQEKDALGRDGEGIMKVLRLALNALETCSCRRMSDSVEDEDTDGCYRCIRTYHLQYNADTISREKGITLLRQLIAAGESRVPQKELESIKPVSPFGSILEKKVVDKLKEYVLQKKGSWDKTIIKGTEGYRFSLPDSGRIWDLELQPKLGIAQGVLVASQPDFLLRCDDENVKPVAIFADGFQFHCYPNNCLRDDIQKRRSILDSGNYHVWSVSWEDLNPDNPTENMVCHFKVGEMIHRFASILKGKGQALPPVQSVMNNGIQQLIALIECPSDKGWRALASFAVFFPLQQLVDERIVASSDLEECIPSWSKGHVMPVLEHVMNGQWVYNDKVSMTDDFLSFITPDDILNNRMTKVTVLARLGDAELDVTDGVFKNRWRRFQACMNFYQFCENFIVWSTSEAAMGLAPTISFAAEKKMSAEWQGVMEGVSSALKPFIKPLADKDVPLPVVEYFIEGIDDDAFAELAWPDLPQRVAILAGDQIDFSAQWEGLGWRVIVPDDLHAKGVKWLVDVISSGGKGA